MDDPDTSRSDPPLEETHGSLLLHARRGDQEAWAALVDRMSPLLWSVARSFRLDDATASDVVQIVWLRLLENCESIRDPERLPGWLAITCRREAMAVVKYGRKVFPTDLAYDIEDRGTSTEEAIERNEDSAAVKRAFDRLNESDQRILRLAVLQPELSYRVIAQLLGCPIGSVGPTRQRALRRLEKAMGSADRLSVRI